MGWCHNRGKYFPLLDTHPDATPAYIIIIPLADFRQGQVLLLAYISKSCDLVTKTILGG